MKENKTSKKVRGLGIGENKKSKVNLKIVGTLKEEAACHCKMSEQGPATKTWKLIKQMRLRYVITRHPIPV